MNQPKVDDSPRALTHRTRTGEIYRRPPEVEAQIKELLLVSPGEIEQRITITDTLAPDFVREEALVYLIRAYKQSGDLSMVNSVCSALLQRMARRTMIRLSTLGPDRAEDGYGAVVEKLFKRILNFTSDRGDFLQVKFWMAHMGIIDEVLRKQIRELNRVEEWPDEANNDEGYDHGDDEPLDADQKQGPDVPLETLFAAQQALDSVPEPYRTAYILRRIEKWSKESENPNDETVSKYFGVSGRTIQNWCNKAEEAIARWKRENP